VFCRRLRMLMDLRKLPSHEPVLPFGYRCLPWEPELLARHAAVKYRCFRGPGDGRVFQSLSHPSGCRQLMEYISEHPLFVPAATWLLVYDDPIRDETIDCGTIQGLATTVDLGAIQNVGIAPEHRRLGLGRTIVLKALFGFRDFGASRVSLEVTADNIPAVRLYLSLGFRLSKTLYREVATPELVSQEDT
jgi:GNAT superfamily N-acetyltransferase